MSILVKLHSKIMAIWLQAPIKFTPFFAFGPLWFEKGCKWWGMICTLGLLTEVLVDFFETAFDVRRWKPYVLVAILDFLVLLVVGLARPYPSLTLLLQVHGILATINFIVAVYAIIREKDMSFWTIFWPNVVIMLAIFVVTR